MGQEEPTVEALLVVEQEVLVEGQEVLLVVKLEVLVEAHPEEGEVESAVAVAPSGSLLHLVKILTRSSIHTSKLVKLAPIANSRTFYKYQNETAFTLKIDGY